MKTLRRSIGKPEVGGEPLPPTFQAFQREGIILRRAEVTVIAGTPGASATARTFFLFELEPPPPPPPELCVLVLLLSVVHLKYG